MQYIAYKRVNTALKCNILHFILLNAKITLGDRMKIYGNESNDVIIKEIGTRIKERRIALEITQKELSVESGVSLRMINNVENGSNVSLDNLISILRVLRVAENLDLLIAESRINPFDVVELGRRRKRVYPKENQESSQWKWGDEQ